MTELIIFIILAGICIGTALRTYIPYQRKIKEKKIEHFDVLYAYSAFLSVISMVLIMLPVELLEEIEVSGVEYLAAFLVGIIYGYGGNSAVNELLKSLGLLRQILNKLPKT